MPQYQLLGSSICRNCKETLAGSVILQAALMHCLGRGRFLQSHVRDRRKLAPTTGTGHGPYTLLCRMLVPARDGSSVNLAWQRNALFLVWSFVARAGKRASDLMHDNQKRRTTVSSRFRSPLLNEHVSPECNSIGPFEKGFEVEPGQQGHRPCHVLCLRLHASRSTANC